MQGRAARGQSGRDFDVVTLRMAKEPATTTWSLPIRQRLLRASSNRRRDCQQLAGDDVDQ